jgi:hypothetical protein
LLLESRVLYREADFDDLRERIVPKTVNKRRTGSHQRESIDFEEIAKSIPQFFNGFDNPAFLYKDNFKYWKTRFLRDFYTFANMINIVLGVHLDEDGENLTSEFLSGSIAVKIIRSAKFADEIEKQDIKNSKLRKNHFLKLSQIMKKHGLGDVNLLMYGNGYETKAARTLHGLMAGLLERFSRCWDEIYDKDVRDALKSMKKINFDSKFSPEITDEKMKSKIETWESMRGDYRQFMATIAEVVHQFFIVEQLWTRKYVGAYEKCLPPFFTTKYK